MIEIACIALGIPLGYFIRNKPFFVKGTDYALCWSVRILLFLLGLSQGANSDLFTAIDTLGFQAAIITTCCIIGSLLAAKILNRFIQPSPQIDPKHI